MRKTDGSVTDFSTHEQYGGGVGAPGGYQYASEFETAFTSGEINWRHSYNDRLSVLVGLRALDVGDTLRLNINAPA